MAFPAAAALGVPGLLPGAAPARPAPGDLPEGCVASNETYACAFHLNSTETDAAVGAYDFPVPAFPRTLATITVQLEGLDNGWDLKVLRRVVARDGSEDVTHTQSRSVHYPARTPQYAVREATTHVLRDPPSDAYETRTSLRFSPDGPVEGGPNANGAVRSLGSFHIYYLAEPLAEGVAPERPAATREVPQLQGTPHDAIRPEVDLVAAWLDDERMGDGVLDVRLAVVGSLDRIDWNQSSVPGAPPLGATQAGAIEWEVHFKVQGTQYVVQWVAGPSRGLSCGLYAVSVDAGARDKLLGNPHCLESTNDTLVARVPLRAIGNPGPGVPFEELSANVDERLATEQYPVQRDSAIAQFPFALGGPAVWDELNGCAFCPLEPAWYEPAYLEAHLADVVQIAGAVIAVLTFFVGLLLVRRRRAQTKRLLDEVARVEQEHETDTRAALLALGKLDTRFARLFHEHAITDAQYQVLAQRVATAATRFALRQGLGLDDGLAGDARPSTRRVPVVDADAERPREAKG